MDFYESIFVTTLVSFIGFLSWRVWIIESNHLKHIERDMTEIKNDIKWLVKYHSDDKHNS